MTGLTTSDDYAQRFDVAAAPAATRAALTVPDQMLTWWTSWASITGSGEQGGELHFTFGADDQLVLHVDQAGPDRITWSVPECAVLPDWVGTRVTFSLQEAPGGGTHIDFRHVGMSPRLECFDVCHAGWDQHLACLRDHFDHHAQKL